MIRPRGIGKVLDAAAPNGALWLAGKDAYDAKEPIETVLDIAAPNNGLWQDGYEVAQKHARMQWAIIGGLTFVIGCIFGALLSTAVDGFAWPLMFAAGFAAAFFVAWPASKPIVDKIYD